MSTTKRDGTDEENKKHNLAAVEEILNRQKWIYAKSMPKIPHEYCLLKYWIGDRNDMLIAAKAIWQYGEERKFFKKTFRYLFIKDYQYWSMDPTPEATDLINRARVVK